MVRYTWQVKMIDWRVTERGQYESMLLGCTNWSRIDTEGFTPPELDALVEVIYHVMSLVGTASPAGSNTATAGSNTATRNSMGQVTYAAF